MAGKNMVSFRIPTDIEEQVEEYANERDISKSEAFRRTVENGLALEEMGLSVAGRGKENLLPDGGELKDSIETQQEQINHLERTQQRTTTGILVGVLWIGVALALDLPSWLVIVTGALLVALIGAALYREL